MARRLEQDFGRYDTDFTDDAAFLAMPLAIRAKAYLFLLALSGWSRRKLTDGRVPLTVAQEKARVMGVSIGPAVAALAAAGMVEDRGAELVCIKYSKWNETRAEIEEMRRQARERQARSRESRASHADVTRDSRVSHVAEKEREIEVEEKGLKTPLSPPAVDKPVENGNGRPGFRVDEGFQPGPVVVRRLADHLPKPKPKRCKVCRSADLVEDTDRGMFCADHQPQEVAAH